MAFSVPGNRMITHMCRPSGPRLLQWLGSLPPPPLLLLLLPPPTGAPGVHQTWALAHQSLRGRWARGCRLWRRLMMGGEAT